MRLFVIVFLLVFTFVSAMGEDLQRLSLDDASAIGTTIQTDAAVKAEGAGSVRITTKHPTTICLEEIAGLDVENAKLIYNIVINGSGTVWVDDVVLSRAPLK